MFPRKIITKINEKEHLRHSPPPPHTVLYCAGIFKKSMVGARNQGGIGLSYRSARLHTLAEFIPGNQFRGPNNN
jgi:hypothetical protein